MTELEKKVKARARVRLTIDVEVSDRWGGDCPVSQVMRQAKESAKGRVRMLLEGAIPNLKPPVTEFRIVNEPEVTAVFTEES